MECQVCYREVVGFEITIDYPLTKEIAAAHIETTPDRDWIECDGCGRILVWPDPQRAPMQATGREA